MAVKSVTGFRAYHTRSSECWGLQSFSNPEEYGENEFQQ